LEKAEQIHIIESSFKSIIEVLPLREGLFFHNFRPEHASSYLGKTRQNFIEIKYKEKNDK